MEFVILGLLLRDQLTIYQLRSIFNQSFSMIYGDSYGSLQSALKRLLAQGLIRFEETREGGRRKKIYQINAQGKARFFDWMMEDIPLSKLETASLTRLFFLGELEQPGRLTVLARIQEAIDQYHRILQGIQQQNAPYYQLTEPWVRYRLHMLDYALSEMENSRRFFRELHEKETASGGE